MRYGFLSDYIWLLHRQHMYVLETKYWAVNLIRLALRVLLEGGNEWVFCTLDQVTCIEKWNFFLECRRSMSLVKSVLCSMLWVFIIFFMSQGNLCMPGCMENAVAKQLLRLILTGTVVNIACDFFYGLVYKKLFHVSS